MIPLITLYVAFDYVQPKCTHTQTHHCIDDGQEDIEENGVVHINVEGQAQAARGRPEDLLKQARYSAVAQHISQRSSLLHSFIHCIEQGHPIKAIPDITHALPHIAGCLTH